MKLIISYTPLHALIIERLISMKVIDDYYLLYICFTDNKKHRHYYNKIKADGKSDFLVLKHSILFDTYRLLAWKRSLSSEIHFSTISVGNLKHVYSRFIAWILSIKRFMTFDDGSGNISGSGYLYELKEHYISSIFFKIISPSYLYKHCLNRITAHYSLYQQENVYSRYCSKVTKVDLFHSTSLTASRPKQASITVFLGNSFSEDKLLSSEYENTFDIAVVNRLNIDLYLPHPRRMKLEHIKEQAKVVGDDDLISEEVIINLLYSYKEVNVYGCYSTVLFNLVGIDQINLTNLHIDVDKPVELLESQLKKLGVNTLRTISKSMGSINT